MREYNFYDFICFPDYEQRTIIKKEYYDTEKLRINIENSHLSERISFRQLSIIDNIDKAQIQLNNSVANIDMVLLKAINYYNLLYETKDVEERLIYETLYRLEIRNVSFEIYCYEEKLLMVLSQLFRTKRKDIKFQEFIKNLKLEIKKHKYGNEFNKIMTTYIKNVKEMRLFRNSETHCMTLLFMDMQEENDTYNNNLFNQFKTYLSELEKLVAGLEKLLTSLLNSFF